MKEQKKRFPTPPVKQIQPVRKETFLSFFPRTPRSKSLFFTSDSENSWGWGKEEINFIKNIILSEKSAFKIKFFEMYKEQFPFSKKP